MDLHAQLADVLTVGLGQLGKAVELVFVIAAKVGVGRSTGKGRRDVAVEAARQAHGHGIEARAAERNGAEARTGCRTDCCRVDRGLAEGCGCGAVA